VRVLDNSFVGENSILLPGVTIGPNSIVGAGSIVTKDVPPATEAAGVPARVICTLDEYVERYRSKMVPIESTDREALRRELTTRFFGKPR
jgi:serine acetyltransferase